MNNEKENALFHLEKAFEFVEKFHSYNSNDIHTSLLVKGKETSHQSLYNRTMFESMFEYLQENQIFNNIKEEDKYKDIIRKLEFKLL